ncbi:MAG: hypothetical protein B6241_04620 [Spirochaetaceae bacterium 4572_59]|nr:MAG: hypothetical protein B6241_04620 [Spirochaetaceae bacterium 4572_59]
MTKDSAVPVEKRSAYRRTRNILLLLIALLLTVLLIQLVLNLLIMPRMKIGQVLLESTLPFSDETLLGMGGITGQANYLTLNEQELQLKYESYPLVRKAFIQKQFPNTLKIVLYGRSPLGLSFQEEDGHIVPIVFDNQGIIIHKGKLEDGLDLPILSGIRFGPVSEGLALPEILQPFFQNMEKLQADSPVLFNQISEIRVNKKSDKNFYLTLFLSSCTTPVLATPDLNDMLLKKILLVMDVLKNKQILKDIEYADFRSDQVVLKMREDV